MRLKKKKKTLVSDIWEKILLFGAEDEGWKSCA